MFTLGSFKNRQQKGMTSCHTSTSTVATLTTTTSTIMAPKMTLSSTMSSSLVTQTTTSVIPITAAKSTGGFQRLTSPNKLLKKLFSTPPTSPVVNIRDPVEEKECFPGRCPKDQKIGMSNLGTRYCSYKNPFYKKLDSTSI